MLPLMTNREKLLVMQILGSLLVPCFFGPKMEFALDVILRAMFSNTLNLGLTSEAAQCFGCLSIRLANQGEIQLAQRCGKLSRTLSGVDRAVQVRALVGSTVYFQWSESLSSLTDRVLSIYTLGMKVGDVSCAFFVSHIVD